MIQSSTYSTSDILFQNCHILFLIEAIVRQVLSVIYRCFPIACLSKLLSCSKDAIMNMTMFMWLSQRTHNNQYSTHLK